MNNPAPGPKLAASAPQETAAGAEHQDRLPGGQAGGGEEHLRHAGVGDEAAAHQVTQATGTHPVLGAQTRAGGAPRTKAGLVGV